MRFLLTIAQAL